MKNTHNLMLSLLLAANCFATTNTLNLVNDSSHDFSELDSKSEVKSWNAPVKVNKKSSKTFTIKSDDKKKFAVSIYDIDGDMKKGILFVGGNTELFLVCTNRVDLLKATPSLRYADDGMYCTTSPGGTIKISDK